MISLVSMLSFLNQIHNYYEKWLKFQLIRSSLDILSYSFEKFTGEEIGYIKAESEEILILEYVTEIEKGAIVIHVEDPDQQIIWEAFLQKNAEGTIQLSLREEGIYRIIVIGNNSGGSFHVSWTLI